MKKVGIIAKNGMLGHLIFQYLLEQNKYEVIGFDRSDVDITIEASRNAFLAMLGESEFSYVVNCAGILVAQSQSSPETAVMVNSNWPHQLEETLKNTKTKLIQISSDCVYNGKKNGYTEDDISNETNVYGFTKAKGEIVNSKDLTIRTSIIGPKIPGRNSTGLFDWVMKQKGEINGWENCFWNGLTCLELSKLIDKILSNNLPLIGLINFYTDPIISKHDLLEKINYIFNLDLKVNSIYLEKRVNKTLKSKKDISPIVKDLLSEIKDYDYQLAYLYNWIVDHKELYPNYNLK
jgi:dTDP-4-dehydrorhamnose reductase